MTRQEIATMIAGIGLPYAYYQFPEGTGQKLPYIVFYYSNTADMYADQTNYQNIEQLNIELYTEEKDFSKDAAIESTLVANGLTYYKESNYISDERMWQTSFEMDVIITEPVTT